MRNRTVRYIKELPRWFSTNELAYYALGNRMEIHLRDKLAYKIFYDRKKNMTVFREWNNVDISVHRNDKIAALLELKYDYAAKIVRKKDHNVGGAINSLYSDYKKCKRYKSPWHGIIFLSCPRTAVPLKYRGQVRAFSMINRYAELIPSPRQWRVKLKKIVEEQFKPKRFAIKVGTLDIGQCFETNIDLIWFLISKT